MYTITVKQTLSNAYSFEAVFIDDERLIYQGLVITMENQTDYFSYTEIMPETQEELIYIRDVVLEKINALMIEKNKKLSLLKSSACGYVGGKEFVSVASDEDILRLCDLKDESARLANAARINEKEIAGLIAANKEKGMKDQTTKFEPGKTYYCRSIGDSECIWKGEVISRTAKTITMLVDGETLKRRVKIWNGCETIMPFGSYSMAPSFNAERIA